MGMERKMKGQKHVIFAKNLTFHLQIHYIRLKWPSGWRCTIKMTPGQFQKGQCLGLLKHSVKLI